MWSLLFLSGCDVRWVRRIHCVLLRQGGLMTRCGELVRLAKIWDLFDGVFDNDVVGGEDTLEVHLVHWLATSSCYSRWSLRRISVVLSFHEIHVHLVFFIRVLDVELDSWYANALQVHRLITGVHHGKSNSTFLPLSAIVKTYDKL